MRVYRTLDELARALFDASGDEAVRVCELCRVYFDAKNNPPDGVIGVGAITYAEIKLSEFQQK